MSDDPSKIAVRTAGQAYNIEAEAVWIGPDLLVYVFGGEAPHIGAVAMAQPRPSLAEPDKTSATTSVFAYVGHKEDMLARQTAKALASALDTRVVVTAGIHWDDIPPEAIDIVLANSRELVKLLIQRLSK